MNYLIEESNDNRNVIKIEENNKFKYIGSKYSVQREIDKFVSSVGYIKENEIIIVFGLATGEHILELLNLINSNNKILIIEPNDGILKVIKELESYRRVIKDQRIITVFSNNKQSVNLANILGEYNVRPIRLVEYSNYSKLFVDEFNNLVSLLKSFLRETIIRINSESALNKIWFNCYMNNIKYMIEGVSINHFHNLFKNKTAIIVSAGPSLSKNITMLKDLQDKAVLICGGRTLKPLINIGVKADFVCIADEGEVAFNLVEEYLNCNVPLIFYEGTNYKIVREHGGLKMFYTNDKSINNILSMDVRSLGYGGSVAHTCIALAQHLGCKNIILVGQDCAFTDDKQYGEYSISSMDEEISPEKDLFYVEDIYGGLVKTNTLLNSFRHRIEQMIGVFSNINFINCTEGGANINGTEVTTLKDAEIKYLREEISKNLDQCLHKKKINKIDKEKVKMRLYKIADDYNEIKNKCDDILNYCLKIKFNDSNADLNLNTEFNNIDINSIENYISKFEMDFKNFLKGVEFSRLLIIPIVNENEVDEQYQCFINEHEITRLDKKIRKISNTYKACKDMIYFAISLIQESADKL
ncbi:motility associated factor glycosyltransferase family protein [Clostridium beijerinckii]|uniref:Motility associated factor glycosyltransferase family protein n=1 Tax=Clostridium beijerinckii TaxID=1520 RepID=A0A7X9SJX3_CLOBE|nr:6-hydroxymethylpterin diphosphokinase MptE-like protein [Clostridium beijerinckii]NMF03281.1 motility associated factor glycosyltransferase family protein [Clostridium beijerinckii]